MKCLLCENEITNQNESIEHIIPNSIGGKLVSKKLICKNCNSNFGEKYDSSLANDCNVFCNFLNIKRDRGKPRDLIGATSLKTYRIKAGGKTVLKKPYIDISEKNGQKTIKIEAKDIKQFKEIIKGLKRSYPSINTNELLKKAHPKRDYLNEYVKLNFQIGSIDTYRALMKISYFLLKYKNPEISLDDREILSFLKGETNYDYIYFYYPDNEILINKDNTINHTIIIKSYPEENILVSFIELFNTASFVLLLSDNFSENIQINYVYDVLSRKEIQNPLINVPNITKSLLLELFETKPVFRDQFKNKFELFLKEALNRQNKSHMDNLINRAINNSFGDCPEGTTITKEMINEFIKLFEEEITPLIIKKFKILNS